MQSVAWDAKQGNPPKIIQHGRCNALLHAAHTANSPAVHGADQQPKGMCLGKAQVADQSTTEFDNLSPAQALNLGLLVGTCSGTWRASAV
jgi:hypothetical protein